MIDTQSSSDQAAQSTTPVSPPRRRRPFGIYAIVALLLLYIVTSTLYAVAVPIDWEEIPPSTRLQAVLQASYGVVIGVLSLVIMVGLLRLRRWAWYGVMILTGLNMLIAIWQYFNGLEPYLALLYNALIVFYLNQRDVQSAFIGRRT